MKEHCLMRFFSPLSIINSSCLKFIFLTLNSFLASPLSIAYSPTSSEAFLFILILSLESRLSASLRFWCIVVSYTTLALTSGASGG